MARGWHRDQADGKVWPGTPNRPSQDSEMANGGRVGGAQCPAGSKPMRSFGLGPDADRRQDAQWGDLLRSVPPSALRPGWMIMFYHMFSATRGS